MTHQSLRTLLSIGWICSLAVGLTGCGGGGDGGIDEGIDFGDSAPEVVSPSELDAVADPGPAAEDDPVVEEPVDEDADADAPVAIAPPLDAPAPAPEPETP